MFDLPTENYYKCVTKTICDQVFLPRTPCDSTLQSRYAKMHPRPNIRPQVFVVLPLMKLEENENFARGFSLWFSTAEKFPKVHIVLNYSEFQLEKFFLKK